MLLIPCPWCGPRDETEFHYGGQAHVPYPEDPASLTDEQWARYLFFRDNPKGPFAERWSHAAGCRRWFNAVRDTSTNEILTVYRAGEPRPQPTEPPSRPTRPSSSSARPAFEDKAVQAEGGSGGAAPADGHTSVPHTHGGHTHTHPTAPTLRGTVLLGFAGGLVPSPSAVVVLVGAAALGQAWFGLLLVVAYGVGLALTLTAAGFAVVKLGTGMTQVMDKRPRWTAHPIATLVRRTTPLASALVVVALGAGLMLKGAASAFL